MWSYLIGGVNILFFKKKKKIIIKISIAAVSPVRNMWAVKTSREVIGVGRLRKYMTWYVAGRSCLLTVHFFMRLIIARTELYRIL